MSDGRANNGGHKTNGGRKPKAEEQKLIERLSPLADKAYKALEKAVNQGDAWAVKLFFEYLYGKPKQSIEQTTVALDKEVSIEEIKAIKEEFFKKY
jgi:TPR repeat protein